MAQRQPGGAPAPAPSLPDDAIRGMTKADALDYAQRVHDDYTGLYGRLMRANTLPHVSKVRTGLMRGLDGLRIEQVYDRGVFDDPLPHLDAVARIAEGVDDIEAELRSWNLKAVAQWRAVESRVTAERPGLSLGMAEDRLSLAALDREHGKARGIVASLGDLLMPEDFLAFRKWLDRGGHLEEGQKQAAAEEARAGAEEQAITQEFSELEEDDRDRSLGERALDVGKAAWDILGWESVEDFVKDAAMTAATLGFSKYARGAKRANRARKAAKAVKASKAVRRARRLDRVRKLAEAGQRLLAWVADRTSEMQGILAWVKKDGLTTARRIATDVMGAVGAGQKAAPGPAAASRIVKDLIQDHVDNLLGVTEERGQRYVKAAFFSALRDRRTQAQHMLAGFYSLALRRRGITNIVHQLVTQGLDVGRAGIDLAKVGIATAGEVVQDLIRGIPFLDRIRPYLNTGIEVARKAIVKAIQATLG